MTRSHATIIRSLEDCRKLAGDNIPGFTPQNILRPGRGGGISMKPIKLPPYFQRPFRAQYRSDHVTGDVVPG